jgi:2-hydroxy-4-carboxymuconate semialdehyde hemiacetal dehydrogenase
MTKVMIVGPGAFGVKHLEGLQNIDDVQVVTIVGDDINKAKDVASKFGVEHVVASLEQGLAETEASAVILCTPTQMHASQAIQCMDAGKHVEVEIPLGDNWDDCLAVANKQKSTGLVCMVGHTRRFNPSHQWIHKEITAEKLSIQQMDVQTYFFRRENINAKGEPRSWTDHLLWHHAAHTVDLFSYQCQSKIVKANAIQGPIDKKLGIALDMSIQLLSANGAICTLSLSFNNDGPLGTFFRYICDNGTYIARYDDLVNGYEDEIDVSNVDVSMNGIELQDREFFSAIKDKHEPNSSVHQVLDCYRVLNDLAMQLDENK